MSRLWPLGLVVLMACDGKAEDTDPTVDTDTETDTEPLTRDTGGGDAPDPALPPTDVDYDCWAWRAFDSGRDGDVDSVTLYAYDPATLALTHSEDDFDADGEVDSIADYAYDAEGRPVSWSYDQDASGEYDLVETAEYDADGLYTRYVSNDGTLEYVWTYVNEGGLRRRADLDVADDGVIDATYDYTYDDARRRTATSGDTDLDGVVDYVATYVYPDATTADYTVFYDVDGDGVPEEAVTYRFDLDGRAVYLEEEDYVAGTLEATEYTFTPDGDYATYASQYSEDTILQFEQVTTYTYLGAGMRSTSVRIYDFTLDGDTDDEWAYTWDCPR